MSRPKGREPGSLALLRRLRELFLNVAALPASRQEPLLHPMPQGAHRLASGRLRLARNGR